MNRHVYILEEKPEITTKFHLFVLSKVDNDTMPDV